MIFIFDFQGPPGPIGPEGKQVSTFQDQQWLILCKIDLLLTFTVVGVL